MGHGNHVSRRSMRFLLIEVSVTLLLGYLLNIAFTKSMIVGISLFAFYLTFFGYYVGRLFFEEEFKILLGMYFVLCFIIVGESLFLILNVFFIPLITIPYILLPLTLIVWEIFRVPKNNSFYKRLHVIKCASLPEIALLLAFSFSLAVCLYALFSSRTGAPLFSILQVVPSYFWVSIVALITSFIAECYLWFFSNSKRKWILLLVFSVAFVIFGVYLLVFSHGMDADPYGWITGIKADFVRGFKGEQWQIIPLERGTESITASIARLSTSQFDTNTSKVFFDLLSPLLAAIYLPFFAYLFMRKLNQNGNSSLCALGALGFMLFPTFFDFAITNSNYLSSIFLFGTLFIVLKWLNAEKMTKRMLVLLIMSFFATAALHPISGIYAIMAIVLAIMARKKTVWRDLTARIRGKVGIEVKIPISTMIYAIVGLIVAIMPIVFVLKGYDILNYFLHSSNVPMATLKSSLSFDDLARFFTPAWSYTPLTMSHIIGDGYNWIRLPIFAMGMYRLNRSKSTNTAKVWVSWLIISYFVAWFTIVTLLQTLDLDPYRFALMLDLALLPIAGLLIGDLFQAIFLRISRYKIRKLFSAGLIILIAGSLIMPVHLIYALPLFPPRSSNEQPLMGRPTFRAVSDAEVDALNYIANIHQNYAVITSNQFVLEVATALLDFRAFNGRNNVVANSTLITDVIANNNIQILPEVGRMTNSEMVFLLFDDWYLQTKGISGSEISIAESGFDRIRGGYRIFGEQYKVYLMWADMSNIHLVPNQVKDLSMNGNNGTLYNSQITVSGINGSALFLNGKNSYVGVSGAESFNLSKMTVEAWVNLATNATYANPVASKWYGGAYPSRDQFILVMYPTLNQVYFYLSDGTHISYVNTNNCPINQWLHIAATYDGQYMRIYFNGSLAVEKEWSSTIAAPNTILSIGSKSSEVEPQYFNGLIDEVRMYDRPLNSTEVSRSYENLEPMSTEGLVLWFAFDQ